MMKNILFLFAFFMQNIYAETLKSADDAFLEEYGQQIQKAQQKKKEDLANEGKKCQVLSKKNSFFHSPCKKDSDAKQVVDNCFRSLALSTHVSQDCLENMYKNKRYKIEGKSEGKLGVRKIVRGKKETYEAVIPTTPH